MRIQESELILNNRGAVYHLDLLPEELADTIITVGDPDRVELVSLCFDRVEVKRQHREFITHTGWIGQKRLSVISTGIGPDNIDIVLNELDALVNIDLVERQIRPELKSLRIIRIGTSGSLQADIPVDAFVVSTMAIGLDNLLNFYTIQRNEEEKQVLQAFVTQTGIAPQVTNPYIATASPALLKRFGQDVFHGITVTCPGFYGPQGRILRLGLTQPQLIDSLTAFSFGPYRITNFEMETAAIYGLGHILNHQCLSLNAIVANRINGTFTADGLRTVNRLIGTTLEILSASSDS